MTVSDCFKLLDAARVTRARLVEHQGKGLLVVSVLPWQRKRAHAALNDPNVKPVSLLIETKWLAPWRWFGGPDYLIRSVPMAYGTIKARRMR